jgi:GldM C-terminal domain
MCSYHPKIFKMKPRSFVILFVILFSTLAVSSQNVDRSSTSRSLGEFKTAGGVRAVLENFFYETQFRVLSYDITFSGEGFDDIVFYSNNGAAWDQNCQQYIARCRVGTEIMIENVRVIGPDNRKRKLKDILFFTLK